MINCGLGIIHLKWIECCRNCFGVKFNMAWFIDKIKWVRDYCETLSDATSVAPNGGGGRKGDFARRRRSDRGSRKAHGAWREVSARRSETRQHQATCVMPQAVWGAKLDYEDNSTQLVWRSWCDDLLGAQLRV